MDIITLIVAALSPVVVKWITNSIKKMGTLPTAEYRVLWIRFIVAALALIGAMFTTSLGGEFDPTLVDTALLTLFNALGATWLYYWEKK